MQFLSKQNCIKFQTCSNPCDIAATNRTEIAPGYNFTRLVYTWNEVTILCNEVTIWCNEVTKGWNEVVWNEVVMERSDRIPRQKGDSSPVVTIAQGAFF